MARWCALVIVLSTTATGLAQDVTRAEDPRALFSAGLAAAADERWSEAAGLFERSYALSHEPIALYNLAYAYRSLGRFTEARVAFEDALASNGLTHERAEQARTFATELRAVVGRIALSGLPSQASVSVDGRRVPGPEIEVDPGEHRVEVRAGNALVFEWQGAVGRGEVRELVLEAEPPAEIGEADGEDDVSLYVVVASFALAGASLVAALVASIAATIERDDQESNCHDADGCAAGDLDALRAWSLAADVAFGTSLAAAVAGALTFFLRGDPSAPSVSVLGPRLESTLRF